ncbi:hypothetical protein RJ639_037433 [Escallonia herrerae]|uniref:Uncharacterized protein n=1 Tax=Escallonia herrerae TaxID=1293975 RepID=A0AA88WSE7_9ASTE|nr:hypothetical protein RJ639_037433 [Escallonia herrerae]
MRPAPNPVDLPDFCFFSAIYIVCGRLLVWTYKFNFSCKKLAFDLFCLLCTLALPQSVEYCGITMGRTPCCDKNGLKKGPWTQEEDSKLMQHIEMHGPGNWRSLPKHAGLQRCGKSCRLRWTNYLRPDIKRGRFSFEEEETIIQLHSILGNKWSAIAARLPGRTDNEIKNYWNTHIRKRLLKMGIDPVTHSPRMDLLDLSSILNSAQLSLSNFLGLQTLVNPEVVRLANFLASYQESPELLLQKIQEDQLCNAELQNQAPIMQSSQLQTLTQEIQNCTQSSVSCAPLSNQAQLMQGNVPWALTNLGSQNFQENLAPSPLTESLVSQQNYGNCGSDQSLNNNSQNFSFGSFTTTPLSSATPLNSPSAVNNSSTEDEMESYYSNLLKFHIPEGLDFDNFM